MGKYLEFDKSKKSESYEDFEKECRIFLEDALNSSQWHIWVAENKEKITSQPGRITHPFAYMTNVYTIPEYRNGGVGSKLLTSIHKWIKENKYEFVIVWPSDEAVNYYKKNGYAHCTEPMEYFPS
ncbi:GNAT family N-acetyltransferase [Virgibacillus oceani]